MEANSSGAAAAPTPLTRAMETIKKLRAQLDEQGGSQPLAIVGAGLRLPGGIEDLDSYWRALADGRDLVRPLPESRKGPFAAEWEQLPQRGGFLDEVMDFDAGFFGIDADEARRLDPQHRLLLEVAWEALENAALPPGGLDGGRAGLFVGITGQDYWDWRGGDGHAQWTTGNGHCFAVGRLAYALGLAGPAIAADTACSSSLVSIHLARQALGRNECDVALAGGVNLVLSPRSTRAIQEIGALAPDGQCKAFDARANGFGRGEGCGVVVLKRLSDAVRDGDRVHAVLHGSAVNQYGRSTGFTAPNVLSLVDLIEATLADAGLSPADIGLVEAHGTGTSLGDTIEMEAIATALGRKNGGAPLRVGSAKTNLGHLESASGIAGVLKVILCLRHREVPPLANFATLNPLIDLDGTNITLPVGLEPWQHDGTGRYVAVSAFGMGGTNAHLVLGPAEDAAPAGRDGEADTPPVRGFELSARTPEALRSLAARFHERLAELPDESYPAFAYTATHGRTRQHRRARITAPDRAAALDALRGLAEGDPPAAVVLHDGDQDDEDAAVLPRAVVDLPHYPWQRDRYVVEPGRAEPDPAAGQPQHTAETEDPDEAAGSITDAVVELCWQEQPADARAAAPREDEAGWWLLFADRTGLAAELCPELTTGAGDCVTVHAGERYERLGETRYEIDAGRPEDVTALLDELRAARGSPCAGVVYAWGLDTPAGEDDGWCPEPGGVPALVQALARTSGQQPPRLVLVTRGAQCAVERDTTPELAQSPLWGLGRVLQAEHAELRPTIIDLDPAADDAANLLDELRSPGGDGQLAFRDGKRYVPRLAPSGAVPDTTATDWRRRSFEPGTDAGYRVLAAQPGNLDSLTPTVCERTPPGPGELEIEVAAAGLNFLDVLKAMDVCPGYSGTVPLGRECAGRVSAVGEGVTRFAVGDPVLTIAPGAMASFATVPAELAAPTPDALDEEHAAAAPVAFLTALYGLEYLARLGPGEKVLIHSAAGGVGLAAVQVARRNGAEIFATAGTEDKRVLLRELGVRHVMDSRSLRFADELTELTGGRGVDVVLNSIAGEALTRSLSLLAPGGRFVELGKRDVYDNSLLGLEVLKNNRSFFAVDLEQSFADRPAVIATLLDTVVRGFADGDFTALPVTSFRYSEAAAAFDRMAKASHTGKIVLRPDDGGPETVAVRPGGPVRTAATYLITGGLGALGLATARYLVDQGAGRLVLVGRSGPTADAERVLAELRCRAEITVHRADVTRHEDIAAVLTEIDAAMPPLAGIVHAAGVRGDDPVLRLDRTRFRSVADPLAVGAWQLHRATAGRELDFFVLYSSAAALLGPAGQAAHAAAGAFLDALALHRRARGLPASSIHWAPWTETGSGPDGMPAGVLGLRTRDGIDALDRLLRASVAQACVLPLDGDAPADGAQRSSLLPAPGGHPADAPRGGEVHQRLLAVEPGRRRRDILVRHCQTEIARVLGLDAARVDATAPLMSMGFDSLSLLRLRKQLEVSLRISLPATLAWRYPTIDTLIPFLAERMDIALEADTAAAPDTSAGGAPPDDLESELDELSDSDLEALLLAKTKQIDEGRYA